MSTLERERQTDRDRQTDRQRDRQTDRQTETESITKSKNVFRIGNILLRIFALEGFVKACPVGWTDSCLSVYICYKPLVVSLCVLLTARARIRTKG